MNKNKFVSSHGDWRELILSQHYLMGLLNLSKTIAHFSCHFLQCACSFNTMTAGGLIGLKGREYLSLKVS